MIVDLAPGGELTPLGKFDPTAVRVAPSEPALLARWARELRWLRGAQVDGVRWAAVAGRLRFLVGRSKGTADEARRLLEASYAPPRPWAQLVE